VLAYDDAGDARDRAVVASALGVVDRHGVHAGAGAAADRLALVRAYLRAWGRHRDFNLEPALRRMGLALEEAAWE
jgi:hypothetical protein